MSEKDLTGYTGKKHKNYIWVPKSKSDLKEYRDMLRLCKKLEKKDGYFNDKTLGIAQVEKGAIFDGSLEGKDYIKKYQKKTIGNQSYISNARMSLRMARFFGWVTRFPNEEAKYKLTTRGLLLTNFMGRFPGQIGRINELQLMTNDILGMRFYCINDHPRYQNKIFKQRVILNILRFLDSYKYLHNYEIVITALTLRDESTDSLRQAYSRINELRINKASISAILRTCDIDPNDSSSLTGVYDGPKVLCSFLKQLGLVEAVYTTVLGEECINYYRKVYTGSLITNVPKNVFRITAKGKQIVKDKLYEVPIWYEDLPNPKTVYAAALFLLKNNALTEKTLQKLQISDSFLQLLIRYNLLARGQVLQNINRRRIDFEIFRDVPPEEYEKVKNIIIRERPEILNVRIDTHDVLFKPKKLNNNIMCIKCHPPRCFVYKEFRELPNSSDYLAYKLCPNDSLTRDSRTGNILLNKNTCVLCMLCLLRCPVGAISIKGNRLYISEVPSENNKNYMCLKDDIVQLEKATDEIISRISKMKVPSTFNINRVAVINTFERKISPSDQNWTQEEFYVWVRNSFRILGLDARYTGGKGLKTRTDVTIAAPFPVSIEVKSPAEGKVTAKAVRQTVDGSSQLFQKFNRRVYMCAIGQEISPEAKRKADEHKKYQEAFGIKNYCIPLIPSRSLFYLTLLHLELHLNADEIELIFKMFHGEFGREAIKAYLSLIGKLRKVLIPERYFKEIDQIFG